VRVSHEFKRGGDAIEAVRERVREKRKKEKKRKERERGKRPNQNPPPPVVSDERRWRCMVPVREQGPWPWWPWSEP
jgi:hypothetical protein